MTYQREFERRLNVGVIGLGSHAYRNILPAMHYLPVRLRAFCDLNTERAKRTAAEYGVDRVYSSTEEMYRNEELDAVFVIVGPKSYPELATEALENGCNVWIEKPPSVRASDLDRVIVARRDKAVGVGFKKVFLPAAVKVREILGVESTSPLTCMLAEYPLHLPTDGVRDASDPRSANWVDHACHPLSLLLSFGGPVESVATFRTLARDGACILRFKSGVIATWHLGFGVGHSQPNERYSFYTSECTIVIDNGTKVSYRRPTPFEYGKSMTFAPEGLESGTAVWEPQFSMATLENKSEFLSGIYGELMHFCEHAIAGTPTTMATLEFARDVMAVTEAALLSNGESIPVA